MDVTLSLFTQQRTKFTLFDIVFTKTLEMNFRHLESSKKILKRKSGKTKLNYVEQSTF